MEKFDIVIAGGGPVGSVLVHALAPLTGRSTGNGLSVLKVRAGSTAADRPIALSHGSRLILERLGLWQGLPATPIHHIQVSQRGGFGRTVITAADHGIDALGHVVSYRELVERTTTDHLPAIAVREDRLLDWNASPEGIEARLATKSVHTRLLVIADGGRSGHGGEESPETRIKDYRQSAVVYEVDTKPSHGNRAWERFTLDGPVALLPYRDRYALVWTSPPANAERLMGMDDTAFIASLQQAFGDRAGQFRAAGPRSAFPLSLRVHDQEARAGIVTIGNASQTLHPVAGQGLNLGLRDAWELAEACIRALDETPEDLGSAAFARAFASRRRLDRELIVRLTDGLIGAFSLRLPLSSTIRGAALAFLDTVPPARRFLSRRMIFGARALP